MNLLSVVLSFAVVTGETGVVAWITAEGGTVAKDSQGRITEASLGYTWVTDTDMELLAKLKHVRKLDLSHCQIGEQGLARLRGMTSVTDLNLYSAEFVADVALANLKSWKQLERLNLRGTDVTDTSLQYIAGFPNLHALDLSFTQVTNNGLDALGGLAQLEELELGGIKISGSGMQALRLLPKLRVLNLNGTQKRNSGMWMTSVTDFDLELIGSLASLEILDLGGTKVTDLGMKRLAELKKLKRLDLSRTAVTATGLEALAKLPSLERINLWKAKKVDDAAVLQLSRMKSLRILDLSETAITDRTLEALAASPLEQLFLSGTVVSAASVEKFKQERPACQVSWR